MTSLPHIKTDRLVLRPPARDDASSLMEMFADEEVMLGLGHDPVSSAEGADAIIDEMLRGWEANDVGAFIIETRHDHQVVGNSGLMVFDSRSWTPSTRAEAGAFGQPELGWALIRAHWGHGYATEAACAIRAWARRARSVDRLVSLISADNVRSQRVAERLGAVPTVTVTRLHRSSTAVIWEHPSSRANPAAPASQALRLR
jgi:RimJ/RimL family protein N-acetyltransferase